MTLLSSIVEIVSAKRTARAVGTLEPSKQTCAVERVATCSTTLVRSLHICADDAVTDGTFTLPFQCALDITSKGYEALNDTAGAEYDDLNSPQP